MQKINPDSDAINLKSVRMTFFLRNPDNYKKENATVEKSVNQEHLSQVIVGD